MNHLEIEDIKSVAELPYHWEKLQNKTILISGGTGFIGSFLCNVIRYRNAKYKQNIHIISISLNGRPSNETVNYLAQNICDPIDINGNVHFILHMASNTHPQQYKDNPVETITSNFFGCYNLLNLAKEKKAERFLLASSCEIYGNGKQEPMEEDYCGYINCNTARAGYNEAKRVSEALCQSFKQQFGIDFCVFRLARVFGADKTKKDTKAMAQFIQCAASKQNITLKSKGLQRYSYVYIADAVAGILKILLDGATGEAYNISSDDDGMTLGQYAEFLASMNGVKVIYDIEDNPNTSQAQYALLDNKKIKKIGFHPRYSTMEGLKRTIAILNATDE